MIALSPLPTSLQSTKVLPKSDMKQLEEIFRSRIPTILKRKGKIADDLIQKLMNWGHSGFIVYAGNRITRPVCQQAGEKITYIEDRCELSPDPESWLNSADTKAPGILETVYRVSMQKAKTESWAGWLWGIWWRLAYMRRSWFSQADYWPDSRKTRRNSALKEPSHLFFLFFYFYSLFDALPLILWFRNFFIFR